MEIQHQDDQKKGSFYIDLEGERVAEMTYVWAGADKFIIDHTEVSPKLKGMNIGKQLVMAAVKMAREKGLKIIPVCPFAKSVFDRVEDIRDVLA